MPAGCDTGIHGRFGYNCRYYENPFKLNILIREHQPPKPKPNNRVIMLFLNFYWRNKCFLSCLGFGLGCRSERLWDVYRRMFSAITHCLDRFEWRSWAQKNQYFTANRLISFKQVWFNYWSSYAHLGHHRASSAVDARIAPSRHRTRSGPIPIDSPWDFRSGMC